MADTAEAHDRDIKITIIIDFIHVLQYLWDATADLHPTQPGRAGFVEHTARDLLHSNPAQVIHHLATTRTALGDTPAPGLDRAIAYLTAKQPYLHYRQALAMGVEESTAARPLDLTVLVDMLISPSPAPARSVSPARTAREARATGQAGRPGCSGRDGLESGAVALPSHTPAV